MQQFRRWMPAVLVAVGVLVYANSFTGPFIFDDAHGITDNPSIQHLWPVWDALVAPPSSGMAGRPLVNLTFAINYAFGGLNVGGYHAVNLAIHILAGLVLFGVLRRVLEGRAPSRPPGELPRQSVALQGTDFVAFAVVLIWLVHPVLTESVVYISQRTELMMGLFLLLTFDCFLRSLDSAQSQRWQVAAIIACGLGMGCKEVMVVAPVLVLAYDYVFVTGSWKESLRQRRLLYIGLAATWLMLPFLVGGVSMMQKLGHTGEFTAWGYAKTECTVLVHYLRLCFWPRPLLVDYAGWPRVNSVTEIIPQGGLILGLVAVSLWGTWRRRWWGYLGLWFFVVLAPTSSFLPLGTEVGAERRLYLPAIACVVLVVVGVWQWKPVALGAVVLVTGLFGAMTWQRNNDYATGITIWSDTVAKSPQNARAHNNLANALQAVGRTAEAKEQYRLATNLDPGLWKAWHNYAGLLAKEGKNAEALACYRRAEELNAQSTDLLINVGVVLATQGDFTQALQYVELATRVEPGSVSAQYNTGRVLTKLQRPAEAVPYFQKALELQPDSAPILYGLGTALVQCGQTNEARRRLTEAARLEPESKAVRQALEALRQ